MRDYCRYCDKEVEFAADPKSGERICRICGTPVQAIASMIKSGTNINGFLIEGEIGRGGMGVVYKAKQLTLDRHVAFKVLTDELASDAEFVERFFREARSAATLNHPNIVQVYDAGSAPGGIYYFAMELIEGESLESRIKRDGCLSQETAVEIALKIANAMDYAWSAKSLTHGDIKPENIMLNTSGGVKLADMGLAKTAHEDVGGPDGVMATPLYAPPEIIAGDLRRVDCRADMYSFGATLYHMLSGAPPFPHNDPDKVMKCHLNDTPVPLLERDPDMRQSLSALVDKLLLKNPEERPASWLEVAKQLERIEQVERKVFHNSKSHAAPQAAEDEPRAFGFSTISKLAACLLVLCVGAFFLYKHAAPKRGQENVKPVFFTPAGTPQDKPAKPAPPPPRISINWPTLKREIQTQVLQEALRRTKEYVGRMGQNTPADAKNYLGLLNSKQEEYNRLEQTLKTLVIPQLKLEAAEKFKQDIDKLVLSVRLNDKNPLAVAETLLDARIKELKKSEKDVASQDVAKQKQLEREKLAEARLLQDKRQQSKLAERNNAVDKYYLALADFLESKRTVPELDAAVNTARPYLEQLPDDYAKRLLFLKKTVVADADKMIPLLVKLKQLLVDQPLPFDVKKFPDEAKVSAVDANRIKLAWNIGGAKVGGVLSWKKIGADNMAALLEQRLLTPKGIGYLKADESSVVLSYLLLLNAQQSFTAALGKLPGAGGESAELWKLIAQDMAAASKEKKAIALWERLASLRKDGNTEGLISCLNELRSNYRGSQCYARRAQALDSLYAKLSTADPLLAATELRSRIDEAKGAKARFLACAVFNGRYKRNAALNSDGSITKIGETAKQCLDELVANNPDSLKDNKLPFLFWEDAELGASSAFESKLLASNYMKEDKFAELLGSLRMASALELGQWDEALATMQANGTMKIGGLVKIDRINPKLSNWAAAFIFAQGLLGQRYNLPDQPNFATLGLAELTRKADSDRKRMADCAVLGVDLALRQRNLDAAKEILDSFSYSEAPEDVSLNEARVIFIRLLADIQNKNMPSAKLKEILGKVIGGTKRNFDLMEALNGDMEWLRLAESLLSGGFKLDDNTLFRLKSATPRFRDLSGRIALGALARNILETKSATGMPELVAALDGKAVDAVVSGELWQDSFTMRLAAQLQSGAGLEDFFRGELADGRLAALPSYPNLLTLYFAALRGEGKLRAENASERLRQFLAAAAVASDDERSSGPEAIKSSTPVDVIKDMLARKQPQSAYWLGIAALLANAGNATLAAQIATTVGKECEVHMSQEEKALLKAATAMATKKPAPPASDDKEEEEAPETGVVYGPEFAVP